MAQEPLKEKPKIILYMAGVILLVPIVATVLIYFGTHFRMQYLSREVMLNFGMLCLGALFVSYGVWKVRSWGFYLLLAFGLAVIGLDLHQIITNPKTLNFWHFVDITLVVVGLGIVFQEKIKAPYFNPRIRWWERASRHRTDIQGNFNVGIQSTSALILDISASGCFASFDISNVELGSIIDMSIDFKDLHFETKAKYVRQSQKPKGIGLMFMDTSYNNRKILKQILEEIVKKSSAA